MVFARNALLGVSTVDMFAAARLAAGADRLGCRCARPDCAAGTRPAAGPVVIHVIAEQASLHGRAPASEISADGLIAPELIADLATTAQLVPLIHPGDAAPEPGYRPSAALADFVRCRDLTCRWPGSDRPAVHCDLDHTIAYADGGPTHASNLKCYCRIHDCSRLSGAGAGQQPARRNGLRLGASPLTGRNRPRSSLRVLVTQKRCRGRRGLGRRERQADHTKPPRNEGARRRTPDTPPHRRNRWGLFAGCCCCGRR
jgi:hypothetical protein